MRDRTAEFFDGLSRRGHVSSLGKIRGTVRFDLTRDQQVAHWFVTIACGDISVSREERDADCVVQADQAFFEHIAAGETKPLAGMMRNEIAVEGRLLLFLVLDRMLPGPPDAHHPRRVAHEKAAPPMVRYSRDEPAVTSGNLVRILDGNTFMVSDNRGDVECAAGLPAGLFSFDTRFLSEWRLSLDGQRLQPLSIDDLQYFENRFFLVPGAATHYVDAKLSVIRHRHVGRSLDEQVTILNHQGKPAEVSVRLDVGSDFADLSEIADSQKKKGHHYTRVEDGRLRLGYEREKFRRETVISASEAAQVDEHGLTFAVRIDPHSRWAVDLHVETLLIGGKGRDFRASVSGYYARTPQKIQQDLNQWLDRAPRLQCDWDSLEKTYRRSIIDLAALRYGTLTFPERSLPAAGLPWFMTILGRDSIITSLQALPFVPELANTTVRMLGAMQGARLDDFRDEEPGKIPYEFRFGEAGGFDERPQSPYYGSADATPLYVVLLDEYERWTGDAALVREYEPEARAALDWIDEYGDVMGNGYVGYISRNATSGLVNHCWKDSWDSISYRDGRWPGLPRATCELQGYAYDAKLRGARLARLFWNDPGYAQRLEAEAADLKERFNRDFWIEDGEYYALALDEDGARVDALTSNMGHLLWSGIVEKDRAQRVMQHLLGPRLFSGWGVRTLAEGEARFNPIGYHVGTVWPFDNSLIAWGLWRYGFRWEAALLADSIIDAAEFFEGRLPEAFGGYPRTFTKYPVQYPSACSPQAWSTGAPLLFIRTMLGLEPQGEQLVVDPALPRRVGRMELLDIPGRWGKTDAFGRGRLVVHKH
jgi:glycogen debranching enzyme